MAIGATVDGRIAALAAAQHGVVTLAQLVELGLSGRSVQYRATIGRLHRIHRGVYAVGHRKLSPDGMRLGAVLACSPFGALSHHSAAQMHGMRQGTGGRIDVTTTLRSRTAPKGVRIHGTRNLEAADITTIRAIPVTTVARTLVDLAAVLNADALERCVHQAEVLRVLDVGEVARALTRARGRRGTGALRRAIATPSPGTTRSPLERRFLALCRRGGLPLPRLNVHLDVGDRLAEVDALWPEQRVVVELDGAGAHLTRRAFEEDRARDAALVARGYVVVRLTDAQVDAGERALRDLRATLAIRRRA